MSRYLPMQGRLIAGEFTRSLTFRRCPSSREDKQGHIQFIEKPIGMRVSFGEKLFVEKELSYSRAS